MGIDTKSQYTKIVIVVLLHQCFIYLYWPRVPPIYTYQKENCTKFNEKYLLNNKNICYGVAQITVLVVVNTATHHFQQRENIRKTYGLRDLFLPAEVRVVFLLGKVLNPKTQDGINREHNKYGDVIQGDFIDSYHNLTIKGVMGLHWVSTYCPHIKYVLKVDDDVVFDMWKFLKVFDAYNLYASKTMHCHVNADAPIFRTGKWAITYDIFKDRVHYPIPYCNGFAVIISGDIISDLYRATFRVPFYWIDDVYLFGMLPYEIGGINIEDEHEDTIMQDYQIYNCLQKKNKKCPILAFYYSDKTFNSIWNSIKQ